MDPAIGGLAQGLNSAIQQYMGVNVQQMKDQYTNQQAFEQKKSLMDYEQGQKKEFEGFQNQQELMRQSALESYKLAIAGQVDGDTAAEMHPKAFGLVKNFKIANSRWPTVDEADKLFKPLQQDEQKKLNRDNKINTAILQYTEKLEKNPILLKMKQSAVDLDSVGQITEIARGGNTVAASALGVKMARAMGEVGVLTESDITRYVTSGQLGRKAGDKLSLWLKGKPTDTTLDEINSIGQVLKDSYARKTQPIYDTYINRLSENMDISKEEAATRLDVPYAGGVKGKAGKSETDPLGLGI